MTSDQIKELRVELRKLADSVNVNSQKVNFYFDIDDRDDGAIVIDPQDVLALLDHIEQLEQDAARYQWLRHGDNDGPCLRFPLESSCTIDDVWLLRNENLDAVIDAAIAKSSQQDKEKEE